jgi:NAD-specific glutamate dehydrogenase
MVAEPTADVQIVDAIASALIENALPGEIEGFTDDARMEAARFLAACAERRPRGIALVRLETLGGALGERHMRIGIVNDDMPFLVDSVANTLAARGLTVRRLLHPIVCVEREGDDRLVMVRPVCDEDEKRESLSISRSTGTTPVAGASSSPISTAPSPTYARRYATGRRCASACTRTPIASRTRRGGRCSTGSPTAR